MGLQAQDTLGWTVQDDPNQYRGDFSIKKKVGTVNSLINAIVLTLLPRIASFICVAASTRPPNVLISKTIASALIDSASSIVLFM